MEKYRIAALIAGWIFVIGLLALIVRWRVSTGVTAFFKSVFVVLSCALGVLMVLAVFGVYLRGYWTTKALIWFFMLVASFLFSFGDRGVLTRRWRVVTGTVFSFPALSAVLIFVIPSFPGTIGSISIWLRLLGDTGAIYYEDPEIRIQRLCKDCEGFEGFPDYYQKKGPLEFNRGTLYVSYYFNPDSLRVEKTARLVTVYLYKKGFSPVPFTFKR